MIVLFIALGVVAVAVAVAYLQLRGPKKPQPKAGKEPADDFRDRCQKLLETGKLDELIDLARQRIAERPNYTYAHWYLARALYLQQKWVEALHSFNDVARIDPRWIDDSVSPFVRAIEGRLRPREILPQPDAPAERTLH